MDTKRTAASVEDTHEKEIRESAKAKMDSIYAAVHNVFERLYGKEIDGINDMYRFGFLAYTPRYACLCVDDSREPEGFSVTSTRESSPYIDIKNFVENTLMKDTANKCWERVEFHGFASFENFGAPGDDLGYSFLYAHSKTTTGFERNVLGGIAGMVHERFIAKKFSSSCSSSIHNALDAGAEQLASDLASLGMHDLDTDIITQISAMYIEKRQMTGIIWVTTATPELLARFMPKVPFSKGNARHLSKLLTATPVGYALVVHSDASKPEEWFAVGMAADPVPQKADHAEATQQLYARFELTRHMEWQMSAMKPGSCTKIAYTHGRYCATREVDSNQRLMERVTRLALPFDGSPPAPDVRKKMMEGAIAAAKGQGHGTSLIIGTPDSIRSEAERLCAKGRGILLDYDSTEKAYSNLSKIIKGCSSIDGALLLDINGKLHAIGVILDGPALLDGNTARGARYNSVMNYICWNGDLLRAKSHTSTAMTTSTPQSGEEDGPALNAPSGMECIGVIVSEDGMIDIFDTDDISSIKIKR